MQKKTHEKPMKNPWKTHEPSDPSDSLPKSPEFLGERRHSPAQLESMARKEAQLLARETPG